MASEHDGGGPADRPARHRRVTEPVPAQRHFPLRNSALLALVTGLAITTPLLLRVQKHEIALGPERAYPGTVTDGPGAAGAPGTDPASALPASAAASAGDRTATPVSRDATRTPAAAGPGTPTPSATSAAAAAGAAPAKSAAPAAQLSPGQAAAFEDQVVTLTNAQRAAHGCPALRPDARLRLAAVGHSVDMRSHAYFAHDSPDGATPWTRIRAQGYPAPSAENIAEGQSTPQAVVDAWMNSPGHRANILNCAAKAVGVGVQFGPDGPWWTQDFGYS